MLKSIYVFFTDIVKMRSIIYELAKRDFQQQYMGAYLGALWLFLQPLLYITILYTIFSLGFKPSKEGDMPFSLYLIAGMVCWLYFAENFNSTSYVLKGHAFLVKKVDFRLSILPIVKLLSSFLPHVALVFVTIIIAWYQSYPPTLYTLQIVYYIGCMVALLVGLSWITSSTSIFIKDIAKVVAICVQFGFWLTPIFWHVTMVPEKYQWIVKLNPMYYIVTGYRDSLVSQIAFWNRWEEALYFWGFTFIVLIAGINVYRKLRPHFAEVI
jgi:lipopolysaccharide transport system permease protein/teichoic acid transport system permease protein